MYALRYGEGTLHYKGYKTLVGGGVFDDFSKHPSKKISIRYFDRNKKEYTMIYSTAAGAYQFLTRTWNEIVIKFGKKYKINDFSPKNQDKACLVLIKHYCKALQQIQNGNVQETAKKCRNIWASLPNASYGQRTESMQNFIKYYDKHLEEELQGRSELAITNEEIAKFLDYK